MLWNRLIWLGVAAGVLGILHRRFRFAHPGDGGRRKARQVSAERERPGVLRGHPVVVPSARRDFGARTRARQTVAIAGESLRQIVVQRAFLVILAGAVFITFAFGWEVGDLIFGTSSWPVTHLIAGSVLSGPVSTIVAVLIAVFAGELVWKERDVRMSDIVDAAPVPDWVSLAGRFLALAGMIVLLQAVLMAAGITLQAMQGYYNFEPGVYLRILFGLTLADYLIFAALAMAVHVVVDHKYAGHLIVVVFYVFTMFASQFGLQHNLLVYGSDPGWVYSDMNGFGPFVAPFVWFKLYWAGWALLLALAAKLFGVRGRETGARRRVGIARARLTHASAGAAAVAALLILTLGGFIFYNTNILNQYRTPFQLAELRAEYERRYKRFEDAPQPVVAAAELRVEIHPGEPAADLLGSFRLVNRTGSPIDSVHLIVVPEIQTRSLVFDRPAQRVLMDDQSHYSIYRLERALQPGDSLRLSFDLTFRPRGFPNSGIPTAVVENGAYFDRRWLPLIGYQPALELKGAQERREHGLAPHPPLPPASDPEGRRTQLSGDAELVAVDAVIGTAHDQIAITPGTLVREWRANGRRYFHYRTEAPLPFGAPVLSGRYAVLEDRWGDVDLRIFHHPGHDFNVERMLRSMKASLSYYSEHFGPYPFDDLRIVEFPRYASFARAHPHTIAFSEGSAFLTRVEDDDVDRTFFVTAHETAHQWWGGQLIGARVQGSALLSETLAQYSVMMVMEETLGKNQVRRFYDYEMDLYLRSRSIFSNREVPLLEAEDQSYLFYHKGAVAIYTLREQIGEERVNTALRRLLEKHRAGVPPYPTALDLYSELRTVTPDSLHSLLADLFEEITLWDVRAEAVRVEPSGTGEYRVTLDVVARKVRADSIGIETQIPMDDLVEIGVFAGGGAGGDPLYLRQHRIRGGRQSITVTVPRAPASAGVDPYRKLIQREPDDNIVKVESAVGHVPTGR
jgi:ABC-2 type transport system permease protein